MAHHTLTFDWNGKIFRPDTDPLHVTAGDTISFRLGNAPPDSKFKITANDPQFFSAAEVTDSHTKITVVKAASTSLECQLIGADGKVLSIGNQPGAHVEPRK